MSNTANGDGDEECDSLLSQKRQEGEGQALLQKRQEAVHIELPRSAQEETLHPGRPLMLSYALAAWAWRSWEFAVALLLIQLSSSSSLRLVSAYGLVDNFVRVAFGGSVGGYVGRKCIASGTRNFLLLQNACIAVSAACAAVLLGLKDELRQIEWVRWILLVCTIGGGATSSLGSMGIQIAIEKRAVQAMLHDTPALLAETNSGFRAIDLTCQLAAPIVIGLLMTYTSSLTATVLLFAYTMLVWIPEVKYFQLAVHLSPHLRAMSHQEGLQGEEALDPRNPATSTSSSTSKSWGSIARRLRTGLSAALHSFTVYGRQRVVLASFALSVLHCSVLTLGFLMTSYLHWGGLTEAEISIFRGVGALSGLAATAIFPMLTPRLGLRGTGLLGSYYQLACLTLGLLPLVVITISHPDKIPRVAGIKLSGPNLQRLLIAGMAISRTGLWTFDLAVTQLMQDLIAPEDLGLVSGVAGSLDSLFFSISFIAALFVSDPGLFYWLMVASWGITACAALLYTIFYVRSQSIHEH